MLGNHGIGVDPVDVSYATEIGLPVINTPHANVESVAEHAIAQMLALAKRLCESDRAVRSGRFDYRYSREFQDLHGRKLGIVGFVTIGRRTAEIARAAFAMRIVVYSPHADAADIAALGYEGVTDLDALLDQADVVSLHQRLTPETRGLFGRERLTRMKKGAILVNTARGALIDPPALIEAVETRHLGGAALDVFESEPLPEDHPYTGTDGILLTPQSAGATEEAMERTAVDTARQVVDVLEGRRPPHLVNPDTWPRRRTVGPN